MHLLAVGVDGAADGLAVHRDRDQPRPPARGDRVSTGGSGDGPGCLGSPLGGSLHQPGTHRGVDRGGVGPGKHPPQRGLGREHRARAAVELGQHLSGHIGGPPGDRGERSHPGQDRRRTQGQHDRDRVIPALSTAPVGHRGETSQQIRAAERGRGQVGIGRLARQRITKRCRVRVSDDRMNQHEAPVATRSL